MFWVVSTEHSVGIWVHWDGRHFLIVGNGNHGKEGKEKGRKHGRSWVGLVGSMM